MTYYARVEIKAAKKAGLIDILDATEAERVGDNYYTEKIYTVARDVYEKTMYNRHKFVIVGGKRVLAEDVFAF